MGRFDDQYQFGNQDRGYRSDEVRGPTREQWAGQDTAPRDEREESAGGAGGYGNSQNPAWAGQSANLESDVAGRGSYGAKGTEGTSGYGRYSGGGGAGSGEGRMVASPDQRDQQRGQDRGQDRGQRRESAPREHRHFGREGGGGYGVYDIGGRGAEGYHRVANENYDDMLKGSGNTNRPATPRHEDYDYGTRHWGHGEYRGSDETGGRGRNKDEGFFERIGEQIGEKVGRFFGVGPKGYRRSDERIHEDVCETLQRHHEIDASEVEVTVKSGVVKLSGTVDERRTRRMIEDVIDHIPGIQDIENHLRTKNYVARTEEADQLKTEPNEDAGQSTSDRPTLHS